MQQEFKILPKYINTDSAYEELKPDEAPFIKGIETTINGNPDTGIGLNNAFGEGQNATVLTPTRSNKAFPGALLPEGYNKNIGSFESYVTQELYYFNYNDRGKYGIYVLNGNTFEWSKIIEDEKLGFTDDQEAFMAEHRVSLYVVYDKDKNIIEKILLITDGNTWQKWINTIAAIRSDGFNAVLYPYWGLKQPHYDREELLEWPTRPPMVNSKVESIPNTSGDSGKVNQLIDQAFQFAQVFGNTDGRVTNFSSYSETPLIIRSEDFLNNPDNLPKNSKLTLYAGSPLTEYIDIFVRKSSKKTSTVASQITWSDWYKVERIYKFGHDPNVIGTDYWLRTNPWANFNYDTVYNTIEYIFDNSRLLEIINQEDAIRLQNDIPQLSIAQGVLNETVALANNRYGYNNLSTTELDKLDVIVKEKEDQLCNLENRRIRLYAYIGRPGSEFSYISQVGYYLGDDKQMRFGGMITGRQNKVGIDAAESKAFGLDFANKNAFRCYLKGTPYFTDGKWFQVNSDNSLVEIPNLLDGTSSDVQEYIQSVFVDSGYFVCVFDLIVPAGRYIATIGRHNVSSDGDYRATSTYIYGIANSRVKSVTGLPAVNGGVFVTSIKPNAIGTFSKEMEIDCVSGDVDVWGNNADLFYIYCPDFEKGNGQGNFRFIEGYLKETATNPLPVELFPYLLLNIDRAAGDDWGQYTDKNGFYWGKTKVRESSHVDINFICKLNCVYPSRFTIPTSQAGNGWRVNAVAYLSDNNSGVVGDCNRVIVNGSIRSLDNSVGYSNVAISIKDGSTVYSRNDGTFALIVHNGQPSLRSSNIYINAGGNFNITIANCGAVPLEHFSESLSPCSNCNERIYPLPINLNIKAEGGSQYSLKENAVYEIGCGCADKAGRLQFVNPIKKVAVPSFLQRGNVFATYFQAQLSTALQIEPDLKWFAFYVSKPTGLLRYLDWIGDKIAYINSAGEIVSDPASAVFCAIYIDSLYNYNLANNFSLLSNWQFTPDDRIRVLDNGEGQLFDVATYGDEINLQVLGTNYNQAAIAAGIIPNDNQNTTVNVTNTDQTTNKNVTLYVRYDARLNKLDRKTGFWIELYTPFQQTDKLPYSELKWYPVINGTIAEFAGLSGGQPIFNFPTTFILNYWDTYLFSRNISIPGQGDKFFNHPFNSPNVSDAFGANLNSGGRQSTKNDDAKQIWKINNVIKADAFITTGIINGLGTFRNDTQHSTDYDNNHYDGIIAMIPQRGIILFICKNDYFTTNYDFHFAFPNEQGVMVVNQDGGLSRPFQKVGDNYGVSPDDTGTIISIDKYVTWYDRKNEAWVLCDYKNAKDVSDLEDKEGRKYGINSYLAEKTDFISSWNAAHKTNSRFDVISGVDMRTNKIYITFRPRKINSNDPATYINKRRNIDIKSPETWCFDIDEGRWVSTANFTPEGYGKLRGLKSGVEMITFAAGKPYYHLNTPNNDYLNFYGQQTEPVILAVFNPHPELVKIFQGMAQDLLPNPLRIDMVYDNEEDSFSYLPSNYIKKKENVYYGSLLRDMTSYLRNNEDEGFRSTLQDGKRMFGRYCIVRFTGIANKLNEYFQLSGLFYQLTDSSSNKK